MELGQVGDFMAINTAQLLVFIAHADKLDRFMQELVRRTNVYISISIKTGIPGEHKFVHTAQQFCIGIAKNNIATEIHQV